MLLVSRIYLSRLIISVGKNSFEPRLCDSGFNHRKILDESIVGPNKYDLKD